MCDPREEWLQTCEITIHTKIDINIMINNRICSGDWDSYYNLL